MIAGRRSILGFALLALAALGCSRNQLIDVAMGGAQHVRPARGMHVGERLVLSGDMHCHVLPPDAPYHVSRMLADTLALAEKEGLDFVVLTPHVPMRFFMNDDKRSWMLESQQKLRERLAELHPNLVVIPGFEYTDFRYGHVGMSFADPADALVGLSIADAQANPERFFERWVASGGIVTINHPVNRPLPDVPLSALKADMSWRAFQGRPTPPEIMWITEHAHAVETFNASITHLRDQFLVGEEDRSLREAAHLVDRTSRQQHRRIAAVGGSDSHGQWLRATTFVLAKERSAAAIREAVVSGRTCVRGPEACSLQARLHLGGEDAWRGVGDAITTEASAIDVRASGGDVAYLVNGTIVATGTSDQIVSIPIPTGRCATVRAIVGRSWSSSMYVNCELH
jgi:hypothetical protein